MQCQRLECLALGTYNAIVEDTIQGWLTSMAHVAQDTDLNGFASVFLMTEGTRGPEVPGGVYTPDLRPYMLLHGRAVLKECAELLNAGAAARETHDEGRPGWL